MSQPTQFPQWLETHPELLSRNINIHPQGIQSHFNVWTSNPFEPVKHVVKYVESDSSEAAIIELLQLDLASPNHVIPCEVIRSSDNSPCLLLMPFIGLSYHGNDSGTYSELIDSFYQVAEGLEDLHRQNIAHLDFALGNVLRAPPGRPHFDSRVVPGKWYLIDFEQARVFDQGPGHQHAIVLPIDTQYSKPAGVVQIDPYSWDVYCLGLTCRGMYNVLYLCYVTFVLYDSHIVARLLQWIEGDVQGCKGCKIACYCRPTARRVRQALGVVRWCLRTWNSASGMWKWFFAT
ncbi:hypothetical protein BC835DRAFT_1290294 [Cytidiella melzeri]|nr:hypothetical protein BC835DRAFT_1290294 [Cytidiella melzeri]